MMFILGLIIGCIMPFLVKLALEKPYQPTRYFNAIDYKKQLDERRKLMNDFFSE